MIEESLVCCRNARTCVVLRNDGRHATYATSKTRTFGKTERRSVSPADLLTTNPSPHTIIITFPSVTQIQREKKKQRQQEEQQSEPAKSSDEQAVDTNAASASKKKRKKPGVRADGADGGGREDEVVDAGDTETDGLVGGRGTEGEDRPKRKKKKKKVRR